MESRKVFFVARVNDHEFMIMNSISIVLRLIFCLAMVHWGGLKSADFLMIKLCDEDEGANLYWVVVSSILRCSSLFGGNDPI